MIFVLRRLLIAILFIFLAAGAFATEVEFVPMGPAPFLNGLIGKLEWPYPNVYQTGFQSGLENGSIWIKKDSKYVYLCIFPKDTLHSGLDLYIDNTDGDVFMLHVSSAHGSRFLTDSIWHEMIWGPSELWNSNLVESIIDTGHNLIISPEAFEFQIDRQLLPAKYFRFMIHLKRPDRWEPKDSDTLSSANWPLYEIDRGDAE